MKERNLGRYGLTLPVVGFGCMGLTGTYGTVDRDRSLDLLRCAFDLGVRHFDTADIYGHGENERIIAGALKGQRDQITIGTKFGFVMSSEKYGRKVCGDPSYVRAACEQSLKRLCTDYIDVFYYHRVDPTVPIQDTVGAMQDLVTEGKVRFIGLSEVSEANLMQAAKAAEISVIQSEYSAWERGIEARILPVARELGVGLVAYSPLGRGYISENIQKLLESADARDMRTSISRFSPENLRHDFDVRAGFSKLAARLGRSEAELLLFWLLQQGQDIVLIPGTSKIDHLKRNLEVGAMNLTDDEFRALDEFVRGVTLTGARTSDDMKSFLSF